MTAIKNKKTRWRTCTAWIAIKSRKQGGKHTIKRESLLGGSLGNLANHP